MRKTKIVKSRDGEESESGGNFIFLCINNVSQNFFPMNRQDSSSARSSGKKSLRLLPGVIIVSLQWFLWYLMPALIPTDVVMLVGVGASLMCSLALLVWWAFLSRARWFDRIGAIVLMGLSLYAASFLLDLSISTSNMGLMYLMYAIPVTSLAFVLGLAVTQSLNPPVRRVVVGLFIVASAFLWTCIRTDGMNGVGSHELNWRWAKTPEERLLEQAGGQTSTDLPGESEWTGAPEWPGFRGADRNGIVYGTHISSDWSANPPELLWRKPVGPGCSSFSVKGNLFFTQEQRGDFELVSCYNLLTGEPVWQHRDSVRFWDSHAGAGPRSTPTIVGDRLYTMGGTGLLNALNISDGSRVWMRDAATDAGIQVLTWGFTSSPLIIGDVVIVAMAGKLAAFDTANGTPRWFGEDEGSGYSSPQLFVLDSIPQVILMSAAGAVSVDPATGKEFWKYDWPIDDRILQPAWIEGEDFLLSQEYTAVRRVAVEKQDTGYAIRERWTSTEMKVNFNDQVLHQGFAYGFDGPAIACLDLKDGKRLWKGDRYRGWILLLADQEVMLVLSEQGDLALVKATPEKFIELGRIKALKGKTWNHPAMAGNIVLVRNSEEMAAYRLHTAN